MVVAIVIAAAVIVGGIVVVARGGGGELARAQTELPTTLDFGSVSDIADYRPPPALLGYNAAATERALAIIARTIAERDAEIYWLRQRLAEFQPESVGSGSAGASAVAHPDDLAGTGARWQVSQAAVADGVGELAETGAQPVASGGEDE